MLLKVLNISYKDSGATDDVRRKIQAAIGGYDGPSSRSGNWGSLATSQGSGIAKSILLDTVKEIHVIGRCGQKKRREDNI